LRIIPLLSATKILFGIALTVLDLFGAS
jgi:hypothetical protein